MKAFSIKQPWASLIAHGIKNVENRTWKTNFRGRVLVHASAKKVLFGNWYDSALTNNQLLALPAEYCKCSFDYSAIIGEVDIIDCVQDHSSVWAEKDVWNWVLENPVLYPFPISNIKGKLSFWEYTKL